MDGDTKSNIEIVGKNLHRYPMVLIDKVIQQGEIVITEKYISLNDFVFRNSDFNQHNDFIYPSYLIIESFFQSAGLFICECDILPYVILCKNVEVKRQIYAGEIIRHHVTLSSRKGSLIIVSGESRSQGESVIYYEQVYIGFQRQGIKS
ncbi:hypothetical protein [Xenorhabdus bovienii]|uniref:hypothetical protein n=1 Tax=Xenorhabdus bovienii TaxID=40576 RepID=UPI003DA661AC